jgi:tetratricopeptide (TPR) repeat protein
VTATEKMPLLQPRGAVDARAARTSGPVALLNLEAQIEGQEARLAIGSLSAPEQSALIELVALRGHILGRIADYEWAAEHADELCRSSANDALAWVTRARARARFHCFDQALADLGEARRLGADPCVVDAERAEILQSIGEYEEALVHFRESAERRADFATLGALATLYAERGEVRAAEQCFDASRSQYRSVSPIPLALLDFQRGHMWMVQEEMSRARTWLKAAHDALPGYAPAGGHLAEVEAKFGERDVAIERLRTLAASSDDPDYAATLARILVQEDEKAARAWRAKAGARYHDLIERHPEAFSDHAAAFLLDVGEDPHRALAFARANLKVRKTPRAYDLVRRAERAASRTCEEMSSTPRTDSMPGGPE